MPAMYPQRIEALLRKLDASADATRADPSGGRGTASDGLSAGEAADGARLRRLAEALQTHGDGGEPHLTLGQVRALAAEGRGGGVERDLPEHLGECPLCLEALEIVLEGEPAVADAALARFDALLQPAPLAVKPSPRLRLPRRWRATFAAAAAVLLAVGLATAFYPRSTSARADGAGWTYASGESLPAGAAIPDGAALVARDEARTAFADGSEMAVEKDTHLAFSESLGGSTTIDLHEGGVTARVVKQARGRRFGVRTPLCEVIVVGTRFSVASRTEKVQVFEGGKPRAAGAAASTKANEVTAVTVRVDEGAVLVRHRRYKQEARVEAGHVAELRSNSPTIDVTRAPAKASRVVLPGAPASASGRRVFE